MANKNIIVNPVKTNTSVTGTMRTPDLLGNFGVERQAARIAENNTLKYNEIRDTNQMLLGESFITQISEKSLEFKKNYSSDSSYFKDKNMANYIQTEYDNMKETYEAVVKNNGYDNDFMEAYLEKAKGMVETSRLEFETAFLNYTENENKNMFLITQDAKEKLSSRYMVSGDYQAGKEAMFSAMQSNLIGAARGYIKLEKAIENNNKIFQSTLDSDLDSYVNTSNGLEVIKELEGYTFEDFTERYSKLEGDVNGFKVMLTQDNFEKWKNKLSSVRSKIETRMRAETEKTMAQRAEEELKIRTNPVEYAMKNYSYNTNLFEVSSELAVTATNYKTGMNKSSIQEYENAGILVTTIDSSNTKASIYLNTDLNGTDIMKERLNEAFDWIGGLPEMDGMNILDGQYQDIGIIPGYTLTKLYAQGNTAYRRSYDRLYSAENRKIQAMFQGVEFDTSSIFDMFSENVEFGENINGFGGRISTVNIIKVPEAGATLKALELAAFNGDPHAARLVNDLKQHFIDYTKTLIGIENGGILTKEKAKEIDAEDKIGLPITSLTITEKQKLVNSYLEDPNVISRLFGGENGIKKEIREDMGNVIKEASSEFQVADFSYGRYALIGANLDVEEIQQKILNKIQKEDYFVSPDRKGIAPKTKITFNGKLYSNTLIPKYRNKNLYNKNGKEVVFDLGGDLND